MFPGQPSIMQGLQLNENSNDHTARCCGSKGICNQLQRCGEDAVTTGSIGRKRACFSCRGRKRGVNGPTGGLEEVSVDIAEASMGKLSRGRKSALLEPLREYRDRGRFPANPKVVPACHRAKLRLPLTREDCTPYSSKKR